MNTPPEPSGLQLHLFDAPIVGCLPTCTEHYEHVYFLCYGRPTVVGDRDYVIGEKTRDYPITHYVGWTRTRPPLRRVRSHGARSAHFIAQIRPGSTDDEQLAKEIEPCPKCGHSLWYYGESPDAPLLYEAGDVVTVDRGRVKYKITATVGDIARISRISSEVEASRPRTLSTSRLTLCERNSDGYLCLRLAWQDALAESLRNPSAENEQRAHSAYAAVCAAVDDGRRAGSQTWLTDPGTASELLNTRSSR
ncbi:hypothetical protein [Phytoactinopolyspora endophytica]|uniref:hypothetical protein n=1 Tax=Phytoactinopolyspora endophytica TaxID=1642495 RepID=UPI00101C1845|nr:hypothetical protein [Phytoactinopolyspora endophytica]